ncbi:hypothetical protein ASG11_08585 [Sphingomonas sp. Leaf357]|uniref:hypothetical protein n=1 Tax=Sphingomonas sp. Leaf357 TaxID=1736350 RepID=UPI0006F92582|nr:hypothetical protein [Sphingomonas sp. Leaf357]KQS04299.1 hypothetical protein ASG11_08585 [Sphingomonas sp. Leaf357]
MLLLLASLLQATRPVADLPEAERPSVRFYEACINGWSDSPQVGVMSADEFQVFVHRQCARERLTAFNAMDGSITDEKEAEAGMERLKVLEAAWIKRNRLKKARH